MAAHGKPAEGAECEGARHDPAAHLHACVPAAASPPLPARPPVPEPRALRRGARRSELTRDLCARQACARWRTSTKPTTSSTRSGLPRRVARARADCCWAPARLGADRASADRRCRAASGTLPALPNRPQRRSWRRCVRARFSLRQSSLFLRAGSVRAERTRPLCCAPATCMTSALCCMAPIRAGVQALSR